MVGSIEAHRQIKCWRRSWVLYSDPQAGGREPTGRLDLVWTFETSKPTHSNTLTPTRPHHLILSNCSIPWWQRIQIYEPMGAILIQITIVTHIIYLYPISRSKHRPPCQVQLLALPCTSYMTLGCFLDFMVPPVPTVTSVMHISCLGA